MNTQHHHKIYHLVLPVLLAVALVVTVIGSSNASGVPVISIVSVVSDTSVTISGVNFPADQTFTVRMGPYGTYALSGTVVGTKEPASGSSFTATYTIPAGLVGSGKIAIRMDSPQGYYSFNWFYNNSTAASTTATPVLPGYTGYPTVNISSVAKNTSVTVVTNNLPAGQSFTVRMGEYGTKGVGGIVVDTFDSGTGGALTKTFSIPAALADRTKIAIRMDCALGYYAYNWFWNNTAPVAAGTPVPAGTAVPVVPGYVGIPTFSITSVIKDTSVTISTSNFPKDQTFTVKMGEFGTMGIGGIVVESVPSGTGGVFSKTFTIPAALAGRTKIAIRLETASGYYYAYNWFFNNTTN
jgi:hypothetical protein